MPSFESSNEILLGRKRLILPQSIPRNRDWKRGVETYDLTALFPAPGLSGFQVNGNTITPVGGIINLPVNNDLIFSGGAIRQGGTYVVDTVSNLAGLNRGYSDGVRRVSFKGANIRQMITSTGERSVVDGFTVYYDNPQVAGYTKDIRYRNAALGGYQWFVNGDDGLSGLDITGAVPTSGNGGMKLDKGGRLGVYNPTSTADLGDLGDFGTSARQGINYSNKRRAYFGTGGVQINHTGGDNAMGSILLWLNHNRSWMFRQGEGAGAVTELDFLSEGGGKTANLAGCQEPLTTIPTYSRFLTTIAHQNNNDNDHQVILGRQEISAQTTYPYVGVKADGVTPKNTWFRARSYTGQQIGGFGTRALMDLDTSIGFAVTAVDTATATVYTPTTNDTVIEVNLTTAGLLFTPPSAASCPRRFICLNIVKPSPTNNIVIDPLSGNIDGAATRTILGNRKSKIWMYSNNTEWKVLLTDEGIRVDNTLFVDAQYGNNATAQRESFDLPFATMLAAEAAALAGDTIVVRPGNHGLIGLSPTKNVNFFALPGVNIIGGFLQVNDGIEVNFLGDADVTHPGINNIIRMGGGTFRFNFNKITSNGNVFLTNANQAVISNMKVVGKVREGISTGTGQQLMFNLNVLGGGAVDIQNPYFDVEVSSLKNIGLINVTNKCSGGTFIGKYDIADFRGTTNAKIFQMDASNALNIITNPVINIKGGQVYGSTSIWTTSALHFVQGMLSGAIGNFHADNYYGANSFFADNGCVPGNEWIMGGSRHESIDKSLYVGYQSIGTGLTVTKGSVIKNNVVECIASGTPIAGWASAATPAVVFIVGQGMSYVANSRIHKSLNYGIGGVDNQAVGGVNNNYTGAEISFYGTKLSCNNTFGNNWMLYTDEGVSGNTHPDIVYNFYAGCVFDFVNTASPAWLVGNGLDTTNTNTKVYFWDDIVTNIPWTVSGVVDEVVRQNKATKIISAGGTYTVNYNETDLYYDLGTLGNLVLALGDPALYKNMEINLKITSIHPTNTVTIDPAGLALIDGLATFVVPGTSTKMTSINMKSIGTQWIIKSIY